MKKKILTLALSLAMVFCFSATAFAQVSVDGDSWIANNTNSTFTVLVDYTGETSSLTAFWSGGLKCEWGEMYQDTAGSKTQKLIVKINEDTNIGANSIFIAPAQAEIPNSSFRFIKVYVTDQSLIDITKVRKTDNKVKVTWEAGKSGFYQLQYRAKGGSWKNASPDFIKKTSFSFGKLKKGTTYPFRVRCATPAPAEFYGTKWESGLTIDDYIYGPWSDKFSYKVR